MSNMFLMEKCPIKNYKDHVLEWRSTWRNNPEDYSLEPDALELNGYTSLYSNYDLSETDFSWVDAYILHPYIYSRISNKKLSGKKFSGEITFDYTDDIIGLVHGIGWYGVEDGEHLYLKDSDFDRISFPDFPTEIPDYVYIKEYIDHIDPIGFLNVNIDAKKLVENLKVGQQLFTGIPGKFVTVLDIKDGKILLD